MQGTHKRSKDARKIKVERQRKICVAAFRSLSVPQALCCLWRGEPVDLRAEPYCHVADKLKTSAGRFEGEGIGEVPDSQDPNTQIPANDLPSD